MSVFPSLLARFLQRRLLRRQLAQLRALSANLPPEEREEACRSVRESREEFEEALRIMGYSEHEAHEAWKRYLAR
jgi:hypothetical protein